MPTWVASALKGLSLRVSKEFAKDQCMKPFPPCSAVCLSRQHRPSVIDPREGGFS